jgi:hypothetical protein
VVLRKKLAVLLAVVMMLGVMSVSPALVDHNVALAKLGNSGNQSYDGGDANQGGGQEAPKKAKHGEGF